ncbi:Cell division cycle protein 23-like protein [Smittium culicis]|uniref:Cell division cycle protein 23-like protein n=1 Tax=Smittium culicis TaxID=133412 RepID=A0A1R1X0S4_9FUNG|nr:Cell division cycle protein 23-like protein [Smittium culicis]
MGDNSSDQSFYKYFNQLKSILPKSPFVTGMEAVYLYNLRKFDEALNVFESRYREDPFCLDFVDVHSNILYVMNDIKRLSELAAECTRIQRHRPETCCVVGNYYSLRGEHEKSTIYFERALKLDPDYYSAYTLLGHEYMHMKNTSLAIYAYRNAIESNKRDYRAWPNDYRMNMALANCYESSNQISLAIECYKRVLVESPENQISVLSKLAKLNNDLGLKDPAARYYRLLVCSYLSPLGDDASNTKILGSYHNRKTSQIGSPLSFQNANPGSENSSNFSSMLRPENADGSINHLSWKSDAENTSEISELGRGIESSKILESGFRELNVFAEIDEFAAEALFFLGSYELDRGRKVMAKEYLKHVTTNYNQFSDQASKLLESIRTTIN